jgi:hypothetical protein
MSNPQRLEFVTRHFRDLQTIRFAPVPASMVLALTAHRMPQVSPSAGRGLLLVFLFCVAGFYWWSTVAIRRRYGSVKVSREQANRMQRHPLVVVLQMIQVAALVWLVFVAPPTYFSDVYVGSTILIIMLMTILDSTNLASRRIAWSIGLVVLFTVGPFLLGVDGGAAIFALAGAVWLSVSVFDFLLLRRTFAELSTSAPTAATEAVVNHG